MHESSMSRWSLLSGVIFVGLVAIAVGLLTPFSYAVLGLALVWMAVISIWLFARVGQDTLPVQVGLEGA